MRLRMTGIMGMLALSMTAGLTIAASPKPDETYYFATYRVKDQGLIVLVDSYPASLHAKDAYIPLPVAIGMNGKGKPIELIRESFELDDSEGNASPIAAYSQFMNDYEKRIFDESIFRVRPMVIGTQFATYNRVVSRFFPAPGRGTRIDRVELHPFAWFQDVLYFPRPQSLDGVLTLRIKPRGWTKPVEVRFKVPEQRSKTDANANKASDSD